MRVFENSKGIDVMIRHAELMVRRGDSDDVTVAVGISAESRAFFCEGGASVLLSSFSDDSVAFPRVALVFIRDSLALPAAFMQELILHVVEKHDCKAIFFAGLPLSMRLNLLTDGYTFVDLNDTLAPTNTWKEVRTLLLFDPARFAGEDYKKLDQLHAQKTRTQHGLN